MVSGAMKCVKYLIFVFNLVFFLAGLGLVALGAVAQIKFREYSALYESEVNMPAIFLFVTGFVVFTISFFGCFGAYKENYCMVYTYAFLLGFILLLEIVAAALAYAMKIQINLVKPLKDSLPNYNNEKHELVTEAWNRGQEKLLCCGVEKPQDWSANLSLNMTQSLPDSCCINKTTDCGRGLLHANTTAVFNEGCFDKVIYWAGEHNPIITGVVAGLAILEMLCVVFACCLAQSIRREYEAV